MKISIVVAVVCSMSGLMMHGYHKFRCMDCLLTPQHTINFAATPSFKLDKASYIMVDNYGMSTSYVYLSLLDKRAVIKELSSYQPATPITPDLINTYKRPAWRRKQVVGLVLQDFKSMKPSATVGDVLRALKPEHMI